MTLKLFDKNETALEISFVQFSGGERHVQLGEFKNKHTYILRANLRNSNDIFDLLLTADALTQKFEDCELFVEVPYLPYARQDRCLLYTSPSPRDKRQSRMPSSA